MKRPASVRVCVEVSGASVAADVPWADAEDTLVQLVALAERVRARCPALQGVVETVPGATTATPVYEDGDWGDRRTRRPVGF